MVAVSGKALVTFDAEAGGVYAVSYGNYCGVDIMNATTAEALVSSENDFENGEYLYIPSNAAYNGFGGMCTEKKIYIKTMGAGKVCVCAR